MFLAVALAATLLQDSEADFKAWLDQKRATARTRLEERLRDLAEEAKAAQAKTEDLRKRLAGKRLTMTPRTGKPYEAAAILEYTLTDVEIESGGQKSRLPWDTLQPATLVAAADILFESDQATRQFDRGRFLIARRLHVQAKEAFLHALKLDENLQFRVEDILKLLDRAIAGGGSFHGAMKRVGTDGVELTYDFKNEEQLLDFDGDMTVEEGKGILTDGEERAVAYTKTEFAREVDVTMHVAIDTKLTVELFAKDHDAWQVVLGTDEISLRRRSKGGTPWEGGKEITTAGEVALKKDATHEVRIVISEKTARVLLDGKEIIKHAEGGAGSGTVLFRIKGRATFTSPLVIRGMVDPHQIEKQLAAMDVQLRRAVDPDIEVAALSRDERLARYMTGDREDVGTLADHPFYLKHILKDLNRYDEAKGKLRDVLNDERGAKPKELAKELDELIAKYPGVPSLRYLRARLHFSKHDVWSAEKELRKALEIFPDYTEALILLAQALGRKGDCAGGLKASTRAIEGMPDRADAYVERATNGYAMDPSKVAQWIEDLRIAKALKPMHALAGTYLRALRYLGRGPRDLGCQYEFESKHYRVTSDVSLEATKEYAAHLEAAWEFYAESFKSFWKEKPYRKPRVAIFRTRENYLTYDEILSDFPSSDTAGHFHPRYNELTLWEQGDMEETRHTLRHEAFHHFISVIVEADAPYWYNEGIAEYMATVKVKDGKVAEKGLVLPYSQIATKMMLDIGMTIPFEDIMCQSPSEFYSGPKALKYAQVWSMVHFFYEFEKGRYKPLIERYLREIEAGRSIQECFDACFKDDWKKLQKEWEGHVRGLK